MGVDCKVYFPPSVTLRSVSLAFAALNGCKLTDARGYLEAEGLKVETHDAMPEMVAITCPSPAGGTWFGTTRGLYFFEGSPAGERLLLLRSRPDSIAIARRYLLGHGEFPVGERFRGDRLRWEAAYDAIRGELDRRGLAPLPDSHPEALRRRAGQPTITTLADLRRRARQLDLDTYGGLDER